MTYHVFVHGRRLNVCLFCGKPYEAECHRWDGGQP